jgi:hypothetical protein
MRILSALIVVLLAVLIVLAAEPAGAPASPGTEIQVCQSVENRTPVGAADNFKIAKGTKIYVWTRVRGVAPGAEVTIVFLKDGKAAYSQTFRPASLPWRTFAYKTFRAGDAGEWTAEVRGPDGKPLATATFTAEFTD